MKIFFPPVRTVDHGPYEGPGEAWGEFLDWIGASGHKVADDLYECSVPGPESGSDPAKWRTELAKQILNWSVSLGVRHFFRHGEAPACLGCGNPSGAGFSSWAGFTFRTPWMAAFALGRIHPATDRMILLAMTRLGQASFSHSPGIVPGGLGFDVSGRWIV